MKKRKLAGSSRDRRGEGLGGIKQESILQVGSQAMVLKKQL